MATQLDYIRKSEMERVALMKLIPALFKTLNDHYISYYFTPVDGYDIYDAYVMCFDSLTHSIKHRFIIECKIRDRHYPNLLLEQKKYNDLKKKANETDAKILYVNVTPKGSYTFNLSKLINSDTEWITEDHWISTTDKSRGKTSKWVTYIPIESGKWIYHPTDRVFNEYGRSNKTKMLDEEMGKHYRSFCLYKDVLNKKDNEI